MDYTYYILPLGALKYATKEEDHLKLFDKAIYRIHVFGIVEKISIGEKGGYLIMDDGTGSLPVHFYFLNDEIRAINEADSVEVLGELGMDDNVFIDARQIKKINLHSFVLNRSKGLLFFVKYWKKNIIRE